LNIIHPVKINTKIQKDGNKEINENKIKNIQRNHNNNNDVIKIPNSNDNEENSITCIKSNRTQIDNHYTNILSI